jgi:hypothetical protein
MSTIACPVCGTEYESWSTRCLNCGVALVGSDEPIDTLSLDESEQVIYELASWPLDLQASAAEAMAEAELSHAWDGTDLVIHVRDEATVDAILERIEKEAGITYGDAASGDDEAALAADGEDGEVEEDDERDELAYTLDEWRPDERERLAQLLDEGGIDYRWEDDVTLLVDADHEAAVEAALDRVEYPDALPADGDLPAEGPSDGDPELLSSLFLAADRLKHNPTDSAGLADLMAVTGEADPEAPPYGFAKALWQRALERADEIADLVVAEDDHGDEVTEKAAELRELLRPYV